MSELAFIAAGLGAATSLAAALWTWWAERRLLTAKEKALIRISNIYASSAQLSRSIEDIMRQYNATLEREASLSQKAKSALEALVREYSELREKEKLIKIPE